MQDPREGAPLGRGAVILDGGPRQRRRRVGRLADFGGSLRFLADRLAGFRAPRLGRPFGRALGCLLPDRLLGASLGRLPGPLLGGPLGGLLSRPLGCLLGRLFRGFLAASELASGRHGSGRQESLEDGVAGCGGRRRGRGRGRFRGQGIHPSRAGPAHLHIMKVGHLRSFRTQMRRNPPPVARQTRPAHGRVNNLHNFKPSASLTIRRYTYPISSPITDSTSR